MLSDLVIRLRSLLRRRTVESELDDELTFHVAQLTDKLIAVVCRLKRLGGVAGGAWGP